MKTLRRLSLAEQTAAHLRASLRAGHWEGKLPGVVRLGAELDVSQATLRTALRKLEAEGLLTAGGLGRSRTVTDSGQGGRPRRTLRVGILPHDPRGGGQAQVELEIINALEAAGHAVFICKKSQVELRHDLGRMIRQLRETPAEAWVVESGSSPLLEWFAGQTVPAMAIFGRAASVPMASTGPDKVPAYVAATRQLIALGHRRIVLIALSPRRKPAPGNIERAFLAELTAHRISAGAFNLPDWEETPEGFQTLLETLFQHTPPTALIIEETPRVIAAMQFLARRHRDVPGHVSLVSTDWDSSLAWCHPPIAHMRWKAEGLVRRVVRWVAAVQDGHPDRERIVVPVEFVPGGSIGPVRQE